jgi:hypothetical protein
MKKFIIGFIIGALLTLGSSVFAEQVKQYILTEASYPIFVNGFEYSDKELPILNYNGNTYIPLSKIGDITGLNYRWNDTLKRVEISTASTSSNESREIVHRENIENEIIKDFTDDIKLETGNKTGLKVIGKNDDGSDLIAFEVYDENGKLIGRYTDSDDTNLVIAQLQRKSELPPKISEGWINENLLKKIYSYDIVYDGNNLIIKNSPVVTKQEEFLRLNVPDGWEDAETGETISNGVKIKKYNGENYFNINDLINKGVIK